MDSIDTRILVALAEHARKPVVTVAKEARVSREVATYRINRLQEQGVIRGFSCRINLGSFVHSGHMLLFRVRRLDETRQQEIARFVQDHGCVWLGRTTGQWDFLFSFLTKTPAELTATLTSLTDFLAEDLEERVLLTMVEEYKDTFLPVLGHNQQVPVTLTSSDQADLDEKDILLLKSLAVNCTTALHTVGEAIGLSGEAVRLRINALEHRGVITGYRTMLNQTGLGVQMFFVMFTLRPGTSNAERLVAMYCRDHPNIMFANRTVGTFDVIAVMFAHDVRSFDAILRSMRSDLRDHITGVNTMILLDTLVHTQLPNNLLN